MRPEPQGDLPRSLSLDDYFNSRMISTPLRLFDCDVPCDGATAVIVSRRELAEDMAQPPVYIEAMGRPSTTGRTGTSSRI